MFKTVIKTPELAGPVEVHFPAVEVASFRPLPYLAHRLPCFLGTNVIKFLQLIIVISMNSICNGQLVAWMSL
jgi:hypothetical protein